MRTLITSKSLSVWTIELALRIMREDVNKSLIELKKMAAAAEEKKKEYEHKAQLVLNRINGKPADAKEE
jgi:hypothetical protein